MSSASARDGMEGRSDTVVCSSHLSCSLLQRTRWELRQRWQAGRPPLPLGCSWLNPPATPTGGPVEWLYTEHRVVILIDARSCDLGAAWLEAALAHAFASLGATPPSTVLLHVSVALAARGSRPLRMVTAGTLEPWPRAPALIFF